MRVRRRTASGFRFSRLVEKLRGAGWFARATREGGADSIAVAEPVSSPGATITPAGGEPSRRRPPPAEVVAAVWRSPWLIPAAFVLFVFTGYLVAAIWFFPAPFLPSNVEVPRLVGQTTTDAEERLGDLGLVVGDREVVTHPNAPNGQIVWQDPVSGTRVPEGTRVSLSVSGGPSQIPVPDVVGYEAGLAHDLIEAAGLAVQRTERVQTAFPRDVAVNTRPTAGATLRPGTAIVLVVSVGAPTIPIPQVAGLTLEEATAMLEEAGLTVGTFWHVATSAREEDTVFETEPPIGTLTAPGTAVDLKLARRP